MRASHILAKVLAEGQFDQSGYDGWASGCYTAISMPAVDSPWERAFWQTVDSIKGPGTVPVDKFQRRWRIDSIA